MTSHHEIDPSFTDLPLQRLAQAALQRTQDFTVEHADFRLERIRTQDLSLRDGVVQGAADHEQLGFAVRVVLNGTWGFAATDVLTKESAVRAAEEAIHVAQTARPINSEPITLAPEPIHAAQQWVSSYDVDPFTIPLSDKVALLADWSTKLQRDPVVAHVTATLRQVFENKFYADTAGTMTTQQRVRLHPVLEAYAVDETSGRFDSMRTIAPPVGRGWEYLTGTGWDWDAELAELPALLAGKLAAPTVEPGAYDLVVDPSNLW